MEYREKKQLTAEEAFLLWQQSVLSVSGNYEKSPEVLKVDDTVIGTLGNFSVSIGKAKSKKTFNLSAMVAAALSGGQVLRYSAALPDDKQKILYVDTEQSPYHCLKVMKRILMLAGLPPETDCDRMQFLALRKYTPDERIAIIETAIYRTEGLGLVLIDGIRDLVYDINSPCEATCIISKLMQWTDERQIHLHTILHQNKGDENARGHIGTELNNKAETVIPVEKDKDDKEISKVESLHLRAMDFTPFGFRINEQSLPELVEEYEPKEPRAGRPKKEPFDPYKEIPEAVHRRALTNAFANGVVSKYDNLIPALQTAYEAEGFRLNYNKAVVLAKFLKNKRMIERVGSDYSFLADYHY